MMISALTLYLLLAATSGNGAALELNLICMGGGSANGVEVQTATAFDNHGNTASAQALRNTEQPFSEQVDLRFSGGKGEVRMPRAMLPKFHGGKGGWMEIENLQVSDREITGSAAVNFINSPKLRVDRITGVLSINGKAGSFTGQCRPFDPATAQRAF